jgi:hypothetical protein
MLFESGHAWLVGVALMACACGGKGDTRELPMRAGVAGATLSLRCNKDLGGNDQDPECRDMNPGTYAPGATTTKPPKAPVVPGGKVAK